MEFTNTDSIIVMFIVQCQSTQQDRGRMSIFVVKKRLLNNQLTANKPQLISHQSSIIRVVHRKNIISCATFYTNKIRSISIHPSMLVSPIECPFITVALINVAYNRFLHSKFICASTHRQPFERNVLSWSRTTTVCTRELHLAQLPAEQVARKLASARLARFTIKPPTKFALHSHLSSTVTRASVRASLC